MLPPPPLQILTTPRPPLLFSSSHPHCDRLRSPPVLNPLHPSLAAPVTGRALAFDWPAPRSLCAAL
eukprot:3779123-Pleurochrysis_carterae.AAC.2